MGAFCVCNKPQPRLVCAEFFNSQVVVEARLVRSTQVDASGDMYDGHIYEMQSEKVLRGSICHSFQVWEENSSGRATFDWKVGNSYLLFFYTKDDRGWVLDGCGNSGPIEQKQPALREIANLPKRHGGIIQVAVGGESFGGGAISDVEVNAKGQPGSFSATTDAKGIAEIHVPAGQYTVTGLKQNLTVFDFTYDDPRNVVIENGGCSQVQFLK